jgi:hypothetical protein
LSIIVLDIGATLGKVTWGFAITVGGCIGPVLAKLS